MEQSEDVRNCNSLFIHLNQVLRYQKRQDVNDESM